MSCKCKKPSNVHNGVCGKCLMPYGGAVHGEGGSCLLKPKIKDIYVNERIPCDAVIRFEAESRKLIDRFIEVEMEQLQMEYPQRKLTVAMALNPLWAPNPIDEISAEIMIQLICQRIEMVEEMYKVRCSCMK